MTESKKQNRGKIPGEGFAWHREAILDPPRPHDSSVFLNFQVWLKIFLLWNLAGRLIIDRMTESKKGNWKKIPRACLTGHRESVSVPPRAHDSPVFPTFQVLLRIFIPWNLAGRLVMDRMTESKKRNWKKIPRACLTGHRESVSDPPRAHDFPVFPTFQVLLRIFFPWNLARKLVIDRISVSKKRNRKKILVGWSYGHRKAVSDPRWPHESLVFPTFQVLLTIFFRQILVGRLVTARMTESKKRNWKEKPRSMFRQAPRGRFELSHATRHLRFSNLSGIVEDFLSMKFGKETRNWSY